jgi:histidinol-phosphate aminotransferase
MSHPPRPNKAISLIAPYRPGLSRISGGGPVVKLSANESALGASPRAVKAAQEAIEQTASYPDGSAAALREAIGETLGLEADRIVCGAGSDELLHLLAQAYLGPGTQAIVSQYGFLVYPIVIRAAGGTPVIAPEKDYCTDVDAILSAVTERTRLVFLANPNNPTGSCIGGDELARLHAGLPESVLLVVDAAYAEYVTAPGYEAGAGLVRAHENVVMVRTFSKIGLAALRAGWLYGPHELVDTLNRIRGPFNVSAPAQAAAAAAIADTEFTKALCAHNAHWRAWLSKRLSGNAVRVLPSQGNFVLALFSNNSAKKAFAELQTAGVIVREMDGYGLPDALRISIGTGAAMETVANVLGQFSADTNP